MTSARNEKAWDEGPVAEQFETMAQQREANVIGMWVFLATETLLFGGLFLAFSVYARQYPEAFAASSHHLHWELGAINTVILLTSGFTMALAELNAESQQRQKALVFLLATILLGIVFLGLKAFEYHSEYTEGLVPFLGMPFEYHGPQPEQAKLFFNFYFTMTGLHALHMLVGLGLLGVITALAWRWREPHRVARQVQISGLYWAFVDIVWIFVFTTLYLLKL